MTQDAPPPAETVDLREQTRLVAHRLRQLIALEREGGILDVLGEPAPVPEPPVVAEPQAVPTPSTATRAESPVVHPDARPKRRFTPRVRALDLPADALAPFGDVPARVAACRLCGLCEQRTHTVFGEGTAPTDLVFCGEAPGQDEDRSGRPFVGAAGELLTAMIEKGMRRKRESVFILNALKCRPPGNRTPEPTEIAACRPYLEAQLAVLRPRVIVALGNPACKALLGDVPGISRIRGQVFQAFGTRVVPTYHPAYLLRDASKKREAWEDLKLVLRLLAADDPAPGPTT